MQEFIDQLQNYWLLKKGPASWSHLVKIFEQKVYQIIILYPNLLFSSFTGWFSAVLCYIHWVLYI